MDAGIGYTDVETNREQEGYAMAVYMGEEEVIQKNMALAQEKVYTVEDIEELPEGVRAELIDGQMFYMATPSRKHQGLVIALSGMLFAH